MYITFNSNIYMYILCVLGKILQLSMEDDIDIVFRLMQLWLSNCSDQKVNILMEDIIITVPSYKFIPLTYQLLSRLGGSEDLSLSINHVNSLILAEKLQKTYSKQSLSTNNNNNNTTGISIIERTTTANSILTIGNNTEDIMNNNIDSTYNKSNSDDTSNIDFQLTLCRLILLLCSQHPHHILPQLFALVHERNISSTYDGNFISYIFYIYLI